MIPAPAGGQTLPIPASGEYTVQVGDTLESIATKFLGASARWNELLAANPSITNPHFITPGSKIKIVPAQIVTAKRATIQQVFRQVEQMPFPRPWTKASVGGVLQERDGVRTFEKSSSELKFDNESRMIVSEESVVFLREATPSPENVSRKAIEIRAGQADLDVKQGPNGVENGIEFHIGETRGTTKPGSAGQGASRARRTADGGSRIMVYDGDSEVTTAGRTMAVPQGMGIAVSADGRTSGPEKLMQAPETLSPNASESFDFSNPTFDWEPTPGAVSYTVEVCRDAACGQLVDRAVGIRLTRWTPRVLPIGELYWRVSAVSSSGLDSFVSAAQKFTIKTYWRRPVTRP
ncbi:MAG: LysM peptidoglycan-binding domain-containing protein [Vicinamibacteria bacterium]|nr:LysM peptidoglycan-binding domain-containing protein [Vicinamibacteria bacterium]